MYVIGGMYVSDRMLSSAFIFLNGIIICIDMMLTTMRGFPVTELHLKNLENCSMNNI